MNWKRRSALAVLFVFAILVGDFVLRGWLLGLWFDGLVTVPVPEKLTLLSIGPGQAPPDAEQFHEHPVLGKLEITDPEQRKKIMVAVERGIWQAKYNRGAACFYPRHALRIEQDGELRDYVICFQCSNVEIYAGSVADHFKTTTDHAKKLLNQLLSDADIPLAPERR